MPPKKKTKVDGRRADQAAATIHQLNDVLADILGWLLVNEIMCSRRVCKKWKEAARKTTVPLSRFGYDVNSVTRYNAMAVMTREMPNLQQIRIGFLVRRPFYTYLHKWSDGEDPDERVAALAVHCTPLDIEIVSNFRKLREFEISQAQVNGRYPFLFNSFPLLQKLSINYCNDLKWDLEMLAGLPMLKELDCCYNRCLTGNIKSLRVLKDTLEKVRIDICGNVEGNFMDLADFSHLKELALGGSTLTGDGSTPVTGDIRDIGENDFSSLESLTLPKAVYGGRGSKFQRISDGPDFVRTLHQLKKQRPVLQMKGWYGELSEDSPDRYRAVKIDTPPFRIRLVEAGSRIGYRWCTMHGKPCEVIWLDPEPDSESSDYEIYVEHSRKIESWEYTDTFYRGFHQPPTEEEYHRLVDG